MEYAYATILNKTWLETSMHFNPYVHGIAASAYIWGIALLMNHISSLHHDTPDNLTGTISAISLMVFSASVMAFFFFYRPVALLIEKKHEEAVFFFLKTLGTFGILTLIVVLTIV